jgi:hypothetical protein
MVQPVAAEAKETSCPMSQVPSTARHRVNVHIMSIRGYRRTSSQESQESSWKQYESLSENLRGLQVRPTIEQWFSSNEVASTVASLSDG